MASLPEFAAPAPVVREAAPAVRPETEGRTRALLRRLWQGWLSVARKIGAFQSRVILTVFYFVFLGPFALAVRLFSDPLGLGEAPSWQPLPPAGPSETALDRVRQQS